ncbi:HEAT-like repeat [Nakaseomyces glabratus]
MSSGWRPDDVAVVQLATLLKSCMSPNHDERTVAMDSLQQFQHQPEFFNYLCYILIEGEASEVLKSNFNAADLQNNRATAGMLLKNSMLEKGGFGKGDHDLDYVKSNIVHGLYDNNLLVSNVTGIVITTLFSTYYRQHREDETGINLLSQLLELVSNNNEASVKALSKIMEDSAQFFQLEWAGNVKPIQSLITSFLGFISDVNMSNTIKAESIKCINTIIPLQTQSFTVKIDEFLSSIFHLAQTNEDDEVRTQICISFSSLLEFRPDKLADNFNGIVQFMLHIIGTVHEEKVAIEACEFLHAFATNNNIPEHLVQPFVPDIVPVLLAKMVYNEDTILLLESSNDEDANEDDKDEDIKPIAPRIVKKNDKTDSQGNNVADDDEEDDDDDGDDDVDTQWTLRKCSASTLDVLTNILPHAVLEIAFPYLKEHLTSDKWYIREATVLALGAMADGGMNYFNNELPILIPFLVEQLKDHWAPVRKITCWTLSRFSPWIIKDNVQFLVPVMEPIIVTLMDRKKDVQEAAISSIATFIENCDPELIETILYTELLENFDKCFRFYKKRNLIILYDAVGRFADKCELDDRAMQIILPHLIQKWESLGDSDKELWPLLECLSCVASSLGEKFAPMAPEVYSRAYRILFNCIDIEKRSQNDPSITVPEKDFIITSIDLIDGIVQGLGEHSQMLLFPNDGQYQLLDIMLECLQDVTHEVRQSTYALLGDIVYFYKPDIVISKLSEFLKLINMELVLNSSEEDTSGIPALINAIWALGLISERIDLSSCIVEMSKALLDLFIGSKIIDEAVIENLAITIGRFGLTHPEVFCNSMFATDEALRKWCEISMKIENDEEKNYAYMGFTKIVNILDNGNLMSPATVHKYIKGLMVNVDFQPFVNDLFDFFIRHSNQINNLHLKDDEIAFLKQFS